jgi:hypothetical protein
VRVCARVPVRGEKNVRERVATGRIARIKWRVSGCRGVGVG